MYIPIYMYVRIALTLCIMMVANRFCNVTATKRTFYLYTPKVTFVPTRIRKG